MFTSLRDLDRVMSEGISEGGQLCGRQNAAHAREIDRPPRRPIHVEMLEMRTLFCGPAGTTVEDYPFVGPVQQHNQGGETHMPARAGGATAGMTVADYPFVGPVQQHNLGGEIHTAARAGGETAATTDGGPIVNSSRHIVPLRITAVEREGNQLVARGMMGDQPFSAPLELAASPADGQECPILNLRLGPIHLDLLGLVVDTSRICLDITADPDGGILGDLLCGIANLLNTGTPLGTILDSLGGAVNQVLGAFNQLLGTVFNQLGAASAITGVSGTGAPGDGGINTTCDILNLRLGPIDLNLLGLEVELDNCANGPVRLDITAEAGPGNLLGNLLCGLAGLLNGPNPSQGELIGLLRLIRGAIDDLV